MYKRIVPAFLIAAIVALSSLFGAEPPLRVGQLTLSVQQTGVPQTPASKRKDKENDQGPQGASLLRAVTISLRRVGAGDSRVTIKTTFVGTDVETKQKVVNVERVREADAVPGAGNTYTETSEAFTTYPRWVHPKTGVVTPAHGSKPSGWVVRVFQGETLLASSASSPDLLAWVASR